MLLLLLSVTQLLLLAMLFALRVRAASGAAIEPRRPGLSALERDLRDRYFQVLRTVSEARPKQ